MKGTRQSTGLLNGFCSTATKIINMRYADDTLIFLQKDLSSL